jgi:23S rRNA pseudouridine1911/1915/1917 synthase
VKNTITHKITGGENGLELIAWLATKLNLSRNAAKRLIDSRQVFINNQRVWMARHALTPGDRIEVHGLKPELEKEKSIEILWQDDIYLIINKPAGWLSNGAGSVEERLGQELDRPVHAVHRLDRDTSGCMLLAWRKVDREKMIPVFQRREVLKIYEGLVIGKMPSGLEVINQRIDGEDASTLVKVIGRHGPVSRVEFTLITGRTHQIRRHLNSYGLHLAGEKNYGATVLDNSALRTIQRHMLHAKTLGFPHPVTGKRIQIKAALPEDFKRAAKALGL